MILTIAIYWFCVPTFTKRQTLTICKTSEVAICGMVNPLETGEDEKAALFELLLNAVKYWAINHLPGVLHATAALCDV